MKNRTLTRRLGVHQVPMRNYGRRPTVSGGALNDGFVAGLAGGLRRYHERHGVPVGDLHLSMPISLRAEGDEMGGNRITLMRFDVPVGVVDPAARISAIHKQTGKVRRERSLPYTEWIAGALNLMPRWYIGSILRHVDFLASDVPGIPVPVFLGGARVRMQYAFGPTIGSAVNVTLLTYVDTCALGIDVDTGAIPDYDVFYECLVAGSTKCSPSPPDASPRPEVGAVGPPQRADVVPAFARGLVGSDGDGEQSTNVVDRRVSLATHPFAQPVEQYGGILRAVPQQR
jgi:hypothetical protein